MDNSLACLRHWCHGVHHPKVPSPCVPPSLVSRDVCFVVSCRRRSPFLCRVITAFLLVLCSIVPLRVMSWCSIFHVRSLCSLSCCIVIAPLFRIPSLLLLFAVSCNRPGSLLFVLHCGVHRRRFSFCSPSWGALPQIISSHYLRQSLLFLCICQGVCGLMSVGWSTTVPELAPCIPIILGSQSFPCICQGGAWVSVRGLGR